MGADSEIQPPAILQQVTEGTKNWALQGASLSPRSSVQHLFPDEFIRMASARSAENGLEFKWPLRDAGGH